MLGVYRVQERHQRLHVGLHALPVLDAALHREDRERHQAEVPVPERSSLAYPADPPVVEVFLHLPQPRGPPTVDDDLLVPVGEQLLRLVERVPRPPPLAREVHLLVGREELVELLERERVRVDPEGPHRAAVLCPAADDAEALVDALVLRVLPFGRRVEVPHPVGQVVLHVLQQALGVRVEVRRLVQDVVQVDVVAAQHDVIRLRIDGVVAAAVVEERSEGPVLLTVEVEDHGAHLALRVCGVGSAPVGQAVGDGPVGLLELGKGLLERVLEQDAPTPPAVERAEDYRVGLVPAARLALRLDEAGAEVEDVGVDLHGRHLGSAELKQNRLKRQRTHHPPESPLRHVILSIQ